MRTKKSMATGIILVIIGAAGIYFLDDEKYSFIPAILLGLGIGISITGFKKYDKKF
ncbi:hypothetical protein L1I30_09610 [Gillisia sp. M10.2A]|uniref:PEP-CTERM protein-sorting domain-containing protein n=1 Tax=Gillisia lutea TaxID=2909668 RepID=A0ABS9EGK1_9FLAO|nr:hypothetical protein [Gillisia lutea]MCF4101923.1 hypothetical protein [Gillisia lutea]